MSAGAPSWPAVLTDLIAGHDLSLEDASWAMNEVMSGEASPVQVAGFLVALRAKGETAREVQGLADQMLAHAHRFSVDAPTLDIVGTGGDRAQTVNISTMAAVVCAATGVTVVKHGNRAASSKSGSADVIEALGVDLGLEPPAVAQVARDAGITFCFSAAFHPSMRHAAAARSGLGVATAFNFLGPLTNPSSPTYAAVGCADARMAPLMAGVFASRESRAAVFRGDDGLDEVTLSTTTSVWWVADGDIRQLTLDPQALGVQLAPVESLRGGDAEHNADVARRIFAGERGPVRDAVLLNAGIALAVVAQAAPSDADELTAAVAAGMARAADAIDSGAVVATLERWVAATRTH